MFKKIFILSMIVSLLLFSCKKGTVEKPSKLIDEKTMIAILYDLSVLEAIKSNNPQLLEEKQINPYTYIYEKYKIDSLEFVQNNRYYSTDLKRYKKMFEEVEQQLADQKTLADSAIVKNKNTFSPKKIGLDTTSISKPSNFLKNKKVSNKN